MTKIGIIGGSGLDNPDILENAQDHSVTTRWGTPSAPLKLGQIGGVDVVLLVRHGREHTITPSQVNYRANIQALKDAGCSHVLASTAVGSLRLDIGRGHLVIVDQFIDFTKQRAMSFHESFAPHQPVHAPMADPFDASLRAILNETCQRLGFDFHPTGTVITIEGPRFSTRAESNMFRAWGADIINMSIATEAALANEAGLPYAAVAMSTDYDCWKTDEEPVTWDAILAVFGSNAQKVTQLLRGAIPRIARRSC
ncbi:MAG: S-methyl-5'-thioadenosine phosphorylase [Betaproteobacteria bacterium HGW-Betaproteobacteria-18]|nr:MAG: S-methyl-5'-thioadenosine phosphorylase [Betaproteobacteria bacterium HGW-Betaproteobacteria-18]